MPHVKLQGKNLMCARLQYTLPQVLTTGMQAVRSTVLEGCIAFVPNNHPDPAQKTSDFI